MHNMYSRLYNSDYHICKEVISVPYKLKISLGRVPPLNFGSGYGTETMRPISAGPLSEEYLTNISVVTNEVRDLASSAISETF